MSEANGVLRNHYHPAGVTIYIEKRLTNQSYRLFSQPLFIPPLTPHSSHLSPFTHHHSSSLILTHPSLITSITHHIYHPSLTLTHPSPILLSSILSQSHSLDHSTPYSGHQGSRRYHTLNSNVPQRHKPSHTLK